MDLVWTDANPPSEVPTTTASHCTHKVPGAKTSQDVPRELARRHAAADAAAQTLPRTADQTRSARVDRSSLSGDFRQDVPSRPKTSQDVLGSIDGDASATRAASSSRGAKCRYRIVVWISACPIHSCTRRMSTLAIIRVPNV